MKKLTEEQVKTGTALLEKRDLNAFTTYVQELLASPADNDIVATLIKNVTMLNQHTLTPARAVMLWEGVAYDWQVFEEGDNVRDAQEVLTDVRKQLTPDEWRLTEQIYAAIVGAETSRMKGKMHAEMAHVYVSVAAVYAQLFSTVTETLGLTKA